MSGVAHLTETRSTTKGANPKELRRFEISPNIDKPTWYFPCTVLQTQ